MDMLFAWWSSIPYGGKVAIAWSLMVTCTMFSGVVAEVIARWLERNTERFFSDW